VNVGWIKDAAFGSEEVSVMGIGLSGVCSRGKKMNSGAEF
jgi:hypothetical protein